MSVAPLTDFLLVIPAFRESGRLPPYLDALKHTLAPAGFTTSILVVDDGSPPPEQAALSTLIRPGSTGTCTVVAPLLLTVNQRKGGAILAGWRHRPASRWLAFVDADGAIPAREVLRVFTLVAAGSQPSTAYFSSRQRSAGRVVEQRPLRFLAGRIFAGLVRLLVDRKIHDSQCGFKIVPAALFARIDSSLHGHGFCFDVELLASLRQAGGEVREIPIDWKEQPGGKITPFRHGPRMLLDLWKIRRRSGCTPPTA